MKEKLEFDEEFVRDAREIKEKLDEFWEKYESVENLAKLLYLPVISLDHDQKTIVVYSFLCINKVSSKGNLTIT